MLRSLLSLLQGVPIETKEVIKVMRIDSFNLLVHNAVLAEGIEFSVHSVKVTSDIGIAMLHGEEAAANHVKTIGLYHWPHLYHLGFAAMVSVVSGELSGWHANNLLVVDHLVESADLDNLLLFSISFVTLCETVGVAIRQQCAQIRKLLKSTRCQVCLEAIFRDDEKAIRICIFMH